MKWFKMLVLKLLFVLFTVKTVSCQLNVRNQKKIKQASATIFIQQPATQPATSTPTTSPDTQPATSIPTQNTTVPTEDYYYSGEEELDAVEDLLRVNVSLVDGTYPSSTPAVPATYTTTVKATNFSSDVPLSAASPGPKSGDDSTTSHGTYYCLYLLYLNLLYRFSVLICMPIDVTILKSPWF